MSSFELENETLFADGPRCDPECGHACPWDELQRGVEFVHGDREDPGSQNQDYQTGHAHSHVLQPLLAALFHRIIHHDVLPL